MSLTPTLVLNAGGQSRRMGQPKALLPVPPTGIPLLAHIVRRLRGVVAPEGIVVVTNDPALERAVALPLPARFVPDAFPDTGTLGGIATGLRCVDGWALLVACDLPLVSAALCARLAAIAAERDGAAEPYDVVIPVIDGFAEPLHALYHRRCLPYIEERLARGERRAISFHPDVRVRPVAEPELRAVDPELRSFVNANTPEEWQRALTLLNAEP